MLYVHSIRSHRGDFKRKVLMENTSLGQYLLTKRAADEGQVPHLLNAGTFES